MQSNNQGDGKQALTIQRLFRTRRLHKYLKSMGVIRQLNDSNTFETTTGLMRNGVVIKLVKGLLDRIYNIGGIDENIAVRLTNREFLSAWIVANFPDDILASEDHRTQIDVDLYMISNELIHNLDIFATRPSNDNVRKLIKTVNMYSNVFKLFMSFDKQRQVNTLVKHWYADEKTKREVMRSEKYEPRTRFDIIRTLETSQASKLEMIRKLDNTFNDKWLGMYTNISDQIEKTFERAFSDMLYEDIKSESFELLMRCLTEIKDDITGLLGTNEQKKGDFTDRFDIDLISQMIKNKALSPETFISYSDYLVDVISDLQSAAYAPVIKKEWSGVKSLIQSDDFSRNVCCCVQYILKLIHELKIDILTFKMSV